MYLRTNALNYNKIKAFLGNCYPYSLNLDLFKTGWKDSLNMIAFLMITKQMTFIQEYPRNTKSVVEVFPNLITANLPSLNSPCILVLQELLFTFRTDLHQDKNPVRNLDFAELRL